MKKLKLLLFAVSPFIIGYILNYLMIRFNWYGLIISIISIAFCVYWFFVGYKSYDYTKTKKESILLGNSFAVLNIIVFIFQRLVMGRIGLVPQMFYLPMLRVSSWIQIILLFFVSTHSMGVTFILSCLLMIIIYYAGYSMRFKKEQEIKQQILYKEK